MFMSSKTRATGYYGPVSVSFSASSLGNFVSNSSIHSNASYPFEQI